MGILTTAWGNYQHHLITHPWRTQIIGAGVLTTIGDVITQQFVERKGTSHDFVRTTRMMVSSQLLVTSLLSSLLSAKELAMTL